MEEPPPKQEVEPQNQFKTLLLDASIGAFAYEGKKPDKSSPFAGFMQELGMDEDGVEFEDRTGFFKNNQAVKDLLLYLADQTSKEVADDSILEESEINNILGTTELTAEDLLDPEKYIDAQFEREKPNILIKLLKLIKEQVTKSPLITIADQLYENGQIDPQVFRWTEIAPIARLKTASIALLEDVQKQIIIKDRRPKYRPGKTFSFMGQEFTLEAKRVPDILMLMNYLRDETHKINEEPPTESPTIEGI